MRARRTAGATALGETVVVCDEAVLRALPKATDPPQISGTWSDAETQVTGTLDACRLGAPTSEYLLHLQRLPANAVFVAP